MVSRIDRARAALKRNPGAGVGRVSGAGSSVATVAIWALGNVEPRIHPDAFVHPAGTVIGDVTLGAHTSVWPSAVLRGDYGRIVVGSRVSIQDGAVIHATAELPTIIGNDCVVGHLAHLECCTVADEALIGTGSIVLHGCLVESGALVGAGAVVPNGMVVPSGAMALGVPARLRVDSVDRSEIRRLVAIYVENVARYRRELRRIDPTSGSPLSRKP
jgi:carbonic anhydrase/acetyltransferase-like protein (isoleucine patch superfamily)